MVESIPREETVHQLAEHLVAEIEQVVHLDLRRKEEPKPAVKPLLGKALEKEKMIVEVARRKMSSVDSF